MNDAEVTIIEPADVAAENYYWGAIKWLCNGKLAPNCQQTFGIVHILPGQKNPLQEYQKEGYDLFEDLVRRMESDVVEKLWSVQVHVQQGAAAPLRARS